MVTAWTSCNAIGHQAHQQFTACTAHNVQEVVMSGTMSCFKAVPVIYRTLQGVGWISVPTFLLQDIRCFNSSGTWDHPAGDSPRVYALAA